MPSTTSLTRRVQDDPRAAFQGAVSDVAASQRVLSAFGGLIADVRNDFIRTIYADLKDEVAGKLQEALVELQKRALHWLKDEQGFNGEPILKVSADMRYRGQSYEIDTPLEFRIIRKL